MANQRSVWPGFALMLVFGGIEIGNVARNPRFQQIHNIDVAQLIVAGVCFGVALSILVGAIRGRTTEPS